MGAAENDDAKVAGRCAGAGSGVSPVLTPARWPGREAADRTGERTIRHADRVLELLETDGRRLHATLWRVVRRDDVAEELMQELTLKLAGSDGFAASRVPVAFARRAATNLALDWLRAERRRATWERTARARAGGEGTAGAEDSPAAGLEAAEREGALRRALADGSETDRVVLSLRYLEGASYAEVGAAAGCTAKQARGRVSAALRRMRLRLNAGKGGER